MQHKQAVEMAAQEGMGEDEFGDEEDDFDGEIDQTIEEELNKAIMLI